MEDKQKGEGFGRHRPQGSMATRMAALLFRRRAAAAAPKPLQHYVAGLSTAAGHDVLDDGGCSGGGEGNRKRWLELPPYTPLDANTAARAISRGGGGEGACSNATAIRWVRRCCPHMPASLVQKLFRLRKVRPPHTRPNATLPVPACPPPSQLVRISWKGKHDKLRVHLAIFHN